MSFGASASQSQVVFDRDDVLVPRILHLSQIREKLVEQLHSLFTMLLLKQAQRFPPPDPMELLAGAHAKLVVIEKAAV